MTGNETVEVGIGSLPRVNVTCTYEMFKYCLAVTWEEKLNINKVTGKAVGRHISLRPVKNT